MGRSRKKNIHRSKPSCTAAASKSSSSAGSTSTNDTSHLDTLFSTPKAPSWSGKNEDNCTAQDGSTLIVYSNIYRAGGAGSSSNTPFNSKDRKLAKNGKVKVPVVIDNCAVCGVSTQRYCSTCHKIHYCGEQHQKTHRNIHRKDCYPAEATGHDPCLDGAGPLGKGPYMKATKDIKVMDIIYTDSPLMTGPGCCLDLAYTRFCLGCTQPVGIKQRCSKCNWPLCGKKCEIGTLHAKYECEVFSKNKVAELLDPFQYELVRILRCLLTKHKDPAKYEELMKLDGATTQRKTLSSLTEATKTASIFINKNCKLREFDFVTIDKVCGIVDLQTLASGKERSSMQIFSFPAKLTHSCNPNTRLVEVLQPNGEHLLKIMAIKPIKKGQPITIRLLATLDPTYERQKYLNVHYYFTCRCDLCRDPTEGGTYFSGIKCVPCHKLGGTENKRGYIIPDNPFMSDTTWHCCNCQQPYPHESISTLLSKTDGVFWNFIENALLFPLERAIDLIQDRITELEEVFHPSHFFVWRLRQLLLTKRIERFCEIEQPATWAELKTSFKDIEDLSRSVMDVVYKHQSGFSLIRGRMLFDVVRALWGYIQWSVIFGKAASFEVHTDSEHFYCMLDEATALLKPEVTTIVEGLILELEYMKQNTNDISIRLKGWRPGSISGAGYNLRDKYASSVEGHSMGRG